MPHTYCSTWFATIPVVEFSVQSHPKISAVSESDSRAANNCCAHVPTVQTECAPGGQQLYSSHYGDHYFAACCYSQVIIFALKTLLSSLVIKSTSTTKTHYFRQSASFNKEVFVDFMGAQIKTLAFLAYIIRIYQETIASHANLMVKGIIGLLTLCPPEVAHLRKELVIATRHILATDLRLSKYRW